jgi:hypothetical protein
VSVHYSVVSTAADRDLMANQQQPTNNCAGCSRVLVCVEIATAGAVAQMHSCSSCGTRSWTLDDRPVSLGDVLADIPSRPRAA